MRDEVCVCYIGVDGSGGRMGVNSDVSVTERGVVIFYF